jgi:UDP-N-acetylmuramate dehydrogenase
MADVWQDRCLVDEPMSRHTVWGVGGNATRLFRPKRVADLTAFLRQCPAAEPLLWVGLGSNLLVRDGGFAGTVILTGSLSSQLERLATNLVAASAGVSCAKLARFCARLGLRGGEFFAGIPGTVGGALAMNAGAFGAETWALVHRVQTIDRQGVCRWREGTHYRVGYRTLAGPADEWFLSAEFRLQPGEPSPAEAEIRRLLKERAEKQPLGQRSCGSVFRNPPGDYAGRLIEASGLKGLRVGAAMVSEKHANFIVNTGGASAAEIEELISRVTAVVAERQGIHLVPEVRIVGRGLGEPHPGVCEQP